MSTPPKSHLVLATEGKSHRTKEEMRVRKEAEEDLLSGETMTMTSEVKANKKAAKEFRRLKKIFAEIQKDDAIYSSVINRYCLLTAEVSELIETRDSINYKMQVVDSIEDLEMAEKIVLLGNLVSMLKAVDYQLKVKRDQMLAIEKDNAMTILGALRTVPKKLPSKKSQGKWNGFQKPRTGSG